MTDIDVVIERVQAVAVEPNDVLLVTVPKQTTPEQADRIRGLLGARFPVQRIVVFGADTSVEVLRPVVPQGAVGA